MIVTQQKYVRYLNGYEHFIWIREIKKKQINQLDVFIESTISNIKHMQNNGDRRFEQILKTNPIE